MNDSIFDPSTVGILIGLGIFFLVLLVLMIVSLWKIFEKAGEEGWKAIIPVYSGVVMLKIIGKPTWWIILLLIPYVNIVFGIWTINLLSKSFGKNEGFTALLIFFGFIFFPIMAFSDMKYIGPYGDPVAFAARKNGDKFDFESDL